MSVFRFFLTFFVLSLLSLTDGGKLVLYSTCSNTTFIRNSTYQTNLNRLLSTIPNAAAISGFYNTTSGENPNKIYGLFLCRGDVLTTACQDCVKYATGDVIQHCPVGKDAAIWYDECLLRYSNESIFSTMSEDPTVYSKNPQNATDQARFSHEVVTTMNKTAAQALSVTKKFATKKTNITEFQTLYTLVQCTPDLSNSDCNRCLTGAIAWLPTLCGGSIGGKVFTPSCIVRYEVYPFYNESVVAAPPPPPQVLTPPPGPAINPEGKGKKSWVIIVAIVVPVGAFILLFIVGCCLLTRRGRKKYDIAQGNNAVTDNTATVESLQYDLNSIEAATNNFADGNRLGEGGFGVVYKGRFPNGQEIAVKRLSRGSRQGAEEFKNEAVLVANLQHRNLVRLLGFCVEGEEKILVYEFVPNKSLDHFLFDHDRQGLLDWSRRYKIIEGIARGILYLHEDSRLKIIHRDLKAGNVLLDSNMNPKISDFGMARIFEVDQTQGNTNTIAGTYGYMSPEYAMHGQFSVKSDVYSFGVLVLEILSGKKNVDFSETDGNGNLMSNAWKLWKDGRPLELLDPTLGDSYSRNEVIRCIQVGLLCVQEDPAERPTMETIVLILNSYSVTVPLPNKPAFFFHGGTEPVNTILNK